MVYAVVKDFNKQGCICFSNENSEIVVRCIKLLNSSVDDSRIQVVCLNDPSMYGEYSPYEFIDDLGEFVKRALSM